jgi:hypothetical protein
MDPHVHLAYACNPHPPACAPSRPFTALPPLVPIAVNCQPSTALRPPSPPPHH